MLVWSEQAIALSTGCAAINGVSQSISLGQPNDVDGTGFNNLTVEAGERITITISFLLRGAGQRIRLLYQNGGPNTQFGLANAAVGVQGPFTIPISTNSFSIFIQNDNGTQDIEGNVTYGCSAASPSGSATSDSQRLRQLQVAGAQTIAHAGGRSYADMLQVAAGEGLSGAVAASGTTSTSGTMSPPAFGLGMGRATHPQSRPSPWRVWAQNRTSGAEGDSDAGSMSRIDWQHATFAAGADYRIAPNLLLGVFGGYESFRYSRNDLAGKLTGDGQTAGAYLGWMLFRNIRIDVGAGHSWISYDGTAGAASGSFDANRWLLSGNVTGVHRLGRMAIEPSAHLYWLHEQNSSYVDSLGATQAGFGFSAGRASFGGRTSYSIPLVAGLEVTPGVGIYADNNFGFENVAGSAPAFGTSQGWSERVTGGAALASSSGWSFWLGGEAGNLGTGTATIWTGQASGSLRF